MKNATHVRLTSFAQIPKACRNPAIRLRRILSWLEGLDACQSGFLGLLETNGALFNNVASLRLNGDSNRR